jgi:hypothetical protein
MAKNISGFDSIGYEETKLAGNEPSWSLGEGS